MARQKQTPAPKSKARKTPKGKSVAQAAPTSIIETPTRRGADEQYIPAQIIKAIEDTKGMVTLAARKLGCSYNTLQRYVRLYPEVAEALRDERIKMDDTVELALYNRIMNGDTTAIIFYSKTRLRDRGYAETVRIETWQDEYIKAIQSGEVDYAALREVLKDDDLVTQLFSRSGVSVTTSATGETQD